MARTIRSPASIAITNYRALETFGRLDSTGTQPAAALVECRLETGRTHQIRVHLAHIGAPVLGDQTYGRHRWLKAEGKGPAFERATVDREGIPAPGPARRHPRLRASGHAESRCASSARRLPTCRI